MVGVGAIVWALIGHASTVQFVLESSGWLRGLLPPVVPWLTSPWGRVFMGILGLVWLSLIAWKQESDTGLTGDDLRALRILGSELRPFHMHELAGALSITRQQAMFHVDRLLASGHAHRGSIDLLRGDHGYEITAKGRDTLVKRGLLR